MNKKIVAPLIAALMSFACMGVAQAQTEAKISPIPTVSDEWRFSVSPYGWLPQVNTTVSQGGQGSKNADVSMNNVLSNLKSGAMIAGEAHYGKWGITGDFATATLQKAGGFNFKGDPAYKVGDKVTLQATMATLAGTYTVLNNQNTYVDALVGARWIGLTTTADLVLDGTSDHVSGASPVHATYGIVGANTRYRIMDSAWYIPFYADIGTSGGANSATWQTSLGVGVALSKMVDVSLTYRALGFNIKSGNDNSQLLKGIFHGPQITGTFNF